MSLNPETGQVQAIVAGTYLTAARTAAGSALATQVAFRKRELQHLVLFGAGLQAELHVHAIAEALPQASIPKVTIVNRTEPRALSLKDKLVSSLDFCVDQVETVLLSDENAVHGLLSTADCIAATTNAFEPLFPMGLLPPGCHVNGIGSYTPNMKELAVAPECRVWIDTPDAKTVGDLKDLPLDHPIELLGNILTETGETSRDESECTFFKAVGTAIQDVVTANVVTARARELGLGTEVDMS